MSGNNNHLVLVCGETGTGKSASLRNLPDPENVLYLNCESGKQLPFKSKFKEFTITDPYQIFQAFDSLQNTPSTHSIVIDSATFMMDMFESLHVLPADDTMKGWSNYQQFFKSLMQTHVANTTANVIMTAHTLSIMNSDAMAVETKVPIKGALKNNGIESFFSVVIAAKKMAVERLKDYESDLLVITDKEKRLGYKYVFQTEITEDTIHSRIRGPIGMWDEKETFIDNDINLVIRRLHEFYS